MSTNQCKWRYHHLNGSSIIGEPKGMSRQHLQQFRPPLPSIPPPPSTMPQMMNKPQPLRTALFDTPPKVMRIGEN
ncbi:hypothetical protein Tco_1015600 [Tanacetum coccineum]|uniref:Uncharacterized protein n=1 Tax=Tanacetum coccineum TaxID=301880 RepID=A0ABQ5FLC7_9ASTR